MTEQPIVSSLIQLVALFLPAWAVVMQIFTRIMEDLNLDENPGAVPLVGLGLTSSLVSFYLFGLSMLTVLITTSIQPLLKSGNRGLATALLTVIQAESAFLLLGFLLLILAPMNYFSRKNGLHVFVISVVSYIIMNLGSKFTNPPIIGWFLIFLVLSDWVVIYKILPNWENIS